MRRAALTACLLAALGPLDAAAQGAAAALGERALPAWAPPAPRLAPARDLPAGWGGHVDAATGAIAELWGGGVAAPGALADPATAERAARAVVARHLPRLAPGATPADLALAGTHLEGGRRTVTFALARGGVPVLGAHVAVVFARDRVLAISARAWPATVAAPARAAAGDPTARARAAVTAATGRPARAAARPGAGRVLVPVRADGGARLVPATAVQVIATDGAPGAWDVLVADDGAVLGAIARVREATGTLRYDVPARRPGGARLAAPAPLTAVTLDGAPATTDEAGTLTWAGAQPATVVPGLMSAVVDVRDATWTGAPPALALPPGGTATWSEAADPGGDARLSAFVHVGLGKARAAALLPSIAAWLARPLRVDVTGLARCNALAEPDQLTFFAGDATCAHGARIADIVYHELAHALHHQALVPGVGAYDVPLSEGLADYFAADLVDDHALGRGFLLDDRPVRELDPPDRERVWPYDRTLVPQATGLIVGGALWDLRTRLIAARGPGEGRAAAAAVWAGVLMRAPDIPGSYLAARIADDDDGELANGTPNGCALAAAFGRHGLAPGHATTALAPPTLVDRELAIEVTRPTDAACPAPRVTALAVAWRARGDDGPWTTRALAPDEAGADATTWRVALADVPAGTAIEYRVTATLDDGATLVRPANPAEPAYTGYVGPVTPLWCEDFERGDPGWAEDAPAGDGWQWGAPRFDPAALDPPGPFAGARALGLDLTRDGRYPASARAAITTPAIDARGYAGLRLQYRRHLAVEDGARDRATIEVAGEVVWANAASAAGALEALDHVDRAWTLHDVDLGAYAGGEVAITWALAADDARALGGWTLDDVCLVGTEPLPASPAGGCCGAAPTPGAGALVGLLGAALARRRRRRA